MFKKYCNFLTKVLEKQQETVEVKEEAEVVHLIEEEDLKDDWVQGMAEKTILARTNSQINRKIKVFVAPIVGEVDSDSEVDIENQPFVDTMMLSYKSIIQKH